MLRVFRDNRSFRRLILAHAQSQLGSGAGYAALLLVAYQRLHGGWGVSLVLLSDFLPSVVLSPITGMLADHFSRKRLAIAGDLIRAVAFTAIAVTSAYWVLIPLTLCAGAGSSLWRPAVNATLPDLVSAEDRSVAAAAYSGCMTLGMTLGPALGAAVMLFASPRLLLALNGVSFLFSAAIITMISFPKLAHAEAPAPTPSGFAPARALRAFRQSIGEVRRLPQVWTIIVLSATSVLTSALINVAEPILAERSLHSGADGYSLLVAIYGAGALLGTAFNARLPSAVPALRSFWVLGVVADGLMMACTGWAPVWSVAALTFLLTGIANALAVGPAFRLLQELVPQWLMGRAFGLNDAFSSTAYVIAFLAAGLLEAHLGPRGLFYVAGAATVLIGMVAAVWALRVVDDPIDKPLVNSEDESELRVV